MGSSTEFYNLTWNEFQTTVATSFQDMRSSNEFLDVTLTTDEDHQCQAHKVILSASSRAFFSFSWAFVSASWVDSISDSLLKFQLESNCFQSFNMK